jgi:aldehyde dehydrogenase (NAD+)
VVNTVNGKGRGGCGKHFLAGVEKGYFQLFCYAGSVELGRTVGETCGRHLVPMDLEAGGRNPMVVMADADLDLAVATALGDAFGAGGQRSTSLGNILLHRPVAERFTERFLAGAAALITGNPLSHPEVDFGPLQNHRFAEAFRGHWEKGRQEGATLAFGGLQWSEENRTAQMAGEVAKGAYMQPCVWTGVTPGMWLYRTEVYGPTVNLCEVDSFDQALRLVNGEPAGLASSLFTRDLALVREFLHGTRVRSISINGSMGPAGLPGEASWTRPFAVRGEDPGPAEAGAPVAMSMPEPVDWEALD